MSTTAIFLPFRITDMDRKDPDSLGPPAAYKAFIGVESEEIE